MSTSASIHVESGAELQRPPLSTLLGPWARKHSRKEHFRSFPAVPCPLFAAGRLRAAAAPRPEGAVPASSSASRSTAGPEGAGMLLVAAGCPGMPPSPAPSPRTRPPGGAVAVPAMLGEGRGVRGPEVRIGRVGMSGWSRARGDGVLRCAERKTVPSPASGLLQSVLQLRQTAVPHPPRFLTWPRPDAPFPTRVLRWLCSGSSSAGDGARGFRTASAPANGNVIYYCARCNSFLHWK